MFIKFDEENPRLIYFSIKEDDGIWWVQRGRPLDTERSKKWENMTPVQREKMKAFKEYVEEFLDTFRLGL